MTSLDVYLHQDLIGSLERGEQARLAFRYRSEWVEQGGEQLSLSLPLRGEDLLDSIDRLVADTAEELRRAADEPR